MGTQKEVQNKTQDFFDAIAASRDMTMLLKEKLLNVIDIFMKKQTSENLISVKAVLDGAEDNGLYELDAEMNRYRIIFDILMSESEAGEVLFSEALINHDQLLERYILCIFALRRVEFDKDESFTEEGVRMLRDTHISRMAICRICETEIFAKKEKIYEALAERGIL